MRLLKVSILNEYGPEGYLHFCLQDLVWSFYSVKGMPEIPMQGSHGSARVAGATLVFVFEAMHQTVIN